MYIDHNLYACYTVRKVQRTDIFVKVKRMLEPMSRVRDGGYEKIK